MRVVTIVVVMLVAGLSGAPAFGQDPVSVEYAYGLDPFDPSDAELLRSYGNVLVAQTPLLELRQLDPFKPSHAALLRQLGGGLPLWGLWYPPGPTAWAPLAPSSVGSGPIQSCCPASIVIQVPPPPSAAATGAAPPPGASPPPQPAMITAIRPTTNDGMWIAFAGGRWISAGPAAAFDNAAFIRVGDYHGFPVFRRLDGGDDVIYLPTRQGVVAPYRLRSR